ncbi:MAG: 50S ribosomal protein L27 [Candidatus Komeilibacteria bacterium]
MAHKKAGGTASNLRDSNAQRLGVKLHDGQSAKAGNIIIRQRGSQYRPGKNVMQTKDDTLMATASGKIKFRQRKMTRFDGQLKKAVFVDVV